MIGCDNPDVSPQKAFNFNQNSSVPSNGFILAASASSKNQKANGIVPDASRRHPSQARKRRRNKNPRLVYFIDSFSTCPIFSIIAENCPLFSDNIFSNFQLEFNLSLFQNRMAQHFHGQYGPGRRDLPMGGQTGSPSPRVRVPSANGARGFHSNPTSPPENRSPAMNPMMMMMNMMRKNPNANPEWIEFMLPRMMTQMQTMMAEFRQTKGMSGHPQSAPAGGHGLQKTPNLSGAEMNEIKLALDSLQKKQTAIAAQEAAAASPDKRYARVKLVKQMRMQLQNKYLSFYYIREIRANLMSLQTQLNSLAVYPEDETDLSVFLTQGKELLAKVENPHGGEASLSVVKNVFQGTG
jgi:hypothetical protein